MLKPTEVNILGKIYQIKYCDNPSEVDIFERKSLWGQIDFWTRTIRIYQKDFNAEDIFHSLLHEIMHGIESELCLKAFKEDNGHDELDILALALSDVLFRNNLIRRGDKDD